MHETAVTVETVETDETAVTCGTDETVETGVLTFETKVTRRFTKSVLLLIVLPLTALISTTSTIIRACAPSSRSSVHVAIENEDI